MGLFSRGLIDRIKFDGSEDDVVWKFPHDNLTTGGQLIVNQSQEVVFCKEGAYYDTFGPGTHTLSTANIPLLQGIVNLPFGGKTPFTAEVWYVNTRVFKEIKWGTPNPISVRDPQYQFVIPIRAFGQYTFRISDSKKFMEEIVGTLPDISTEDLQDKFRAALVSKMSDAIAEQAIKQKISVLDMPAMLDEIAAFCLDKLKANFNNFGVDIVELFIESINYPEDDPNVQKINEAYADKLSRDIQGTNYQQERTFDTMQSAAENPGMSGTGMNFGMGMGMGNAMGNAMGNMMNNTMGNPNQPQQPQQPGGAVPPPPPTEVTFHVLINGQQAGPYGSQQLQQLVSQGQLNAETLVWKAGMANWVKAGEVPELQNIFGSVPPPPPPQI